MMKLVLENREGQVARLFAWDTGDAVLIQRLDTRRVEIHRDTQALAKRTIRFKELGPVTRAALEAAPVEIGELGRLRLVKDVPATVRDLESVEEDRKPLYYSLAGLFALTALFIGFLFTRPAMTVKMEEELKQQVVQIVKKIPPRQPPKSISAVKTESKVDASAPKTTKTASIKRMGALAVLGSLSKGSQKGGVNLGAVNTTAGPGLGGNAGSGGTQTSLYGKGLVAAPVGAGSNLQGGGGYGTKGKGGGQAGYGKLSLIGSAGAQPIPLGKEAIIQGGLDFDLVADVIGKNIGQVRFCYEQGLQGDPALAGRVEVAWTINSNGQVTGASVSNTTLNSKMVEDCILMRLRSWMFPLPDGGAEVKVSYPFLLRRNGQG